MRRISRLWKSGIRGKLMIGCGGLIVLFLACLLMIIAIPSPGTTPQAGITSTPIVAKTAVVVLSPTTDAAVASPPKSTDVLVATNTAVPTETPVPPTPSPTMTPFQKPTTIADDFASGGLGLSRQTWEQAHAQSSTGPGSYVNYDAEKYSAIFMDGNVWTLERNFRANQPTLSEARVEGALLIPKDSQLVKTYSPEGFPELIVDLYLSKSLKSRFESDVWIGGEPGNFIVIYGVYDGRVARIVIGTGNHP